MKTVAEVIGVSRSNLVDRLRERPKTRVGRPPLPDNELVVAIKAVIAELPTYGYRRVHAILRRRALAAGDKPPNHKRIYRVMKAHGLILDRHAGGVERRHDGRIAVDERNRRWCSDGFEIGCDNGEKVRVAFALDCCDREALSFLATTSGIRGEDVRDLIAGAWHRPRCSLRRVRGDTGQHHRLLDRRSVRISATGSLRLLHRTDRNKN